jgi:NTE family protein
MNKALIILFLFISHLGFSQTNEPVDLKVGLVLSGGGAKGLSHIGALKVIDSLGIRIDYIAGTSMGAIIGSLYATGYSGKQIDSIFKDVDFDAIISDDLPRKAKTFYERDNSEKYAVTLPFKNFKLKLPSALSRGQNTLSLLTKLMVHVSDIDDFSKLPIPFFCIATNIETGEAVILDKGSLPQATAASSAFPSLFQPVIIDDRMLIDGGVVNNYPIDELKAKGVDVIIGVDVQDDLSSIEDLNSAPDILIQINNYRTIHDMKLKSAKTDVYIKPDISDFNVVSFSQGKAIIDNGEVETKKHVEALNTILSKQIKKKKATAQIKPMDSILIHAINIKGNPNYSRAYVLGKLKFKSENKISYNTFQEGVNNLAATSNFESVIYQLQPSQNSEGYNMNLTLKESQQNTYLKLALHYDDLYKSAALINITSKKLLFNSDVLSCDFILGDNIRYNFDYYIDKGFYWSIGLHSRFNQFSKDIPAASILTPEELMNIDVNKLDVNVQDFTNQFYLQTLFTKDVSLILGAEHKHLKTETETILTNASQEETTFENSSFLSVFGQLKLDTYDDKYFPKEGFYFNGNFHLYLYSSDFNNSFSEFSIAKATFGYTTKFSKNLTANFTAQGGFKIGEDSNRSLNFALGGYGNNFINNIKSFYGYDFLELSGNSFVKGLIGLDYEIFKNNHINLAANYANIDDGIFDTGEWITSPDYSGYAVGYSIDTFFGPLEAKYTWSSETKQDVWFVNIGFWF